MPTMMVGGSTDSEVAEVTVIPVRSSPSPAVTTQTPLTRCRIASRNDGAGASETLAMMFTADPRDVLRSTKQTTRSVAARRVRLFFVTVQAYLTARTGGVNVMEKNKRVSSGEDGSGEQILAGR